MSPSSGNIVSDTHLLHCVSKKALYLPCYSFDKHEPILIILSRNVIEKVGNQKVLYFPTSSNSFYGEQRSLVAPGRIKLIQYTRNERACLASCGYWTTRGLPTRGLDDSRTGQLADVIGDFACLCFRSFGGVCETASCPVRDLSSPRVDQSASWQSASRRIRELSSYPSCKVNRPPRSHRGSFVNVQSFVQSLVLMLRSIEVVIS